MRFGEDFFALFGVALFLALLGAVLVRTAVGKTLRVSAIDGLIVAFAFWCIARALIYADASYVSQLTKLLIPLIGYMVAKNVVPDWEQYRRVIVWIIAGFSMPTLVSAALIAIGSPGAIQTEVYETGLLRWQGAYSHSHTLGHSMTLLLMTLVVHVSLRGTGERRSGPAARIEDALLALLGIVAAYCLYMSQVRSAVLGLLVFLGFYGFLHNRKALLLAGSGMALVAAATASEWVPALLHEFAPNRRTGPIDLMHVGSGRLVRWSNDISVYVGLPLDQKIAGIGIGVANTMDGDWIGGHSDWLRVLWDTGLVGFALFVGLQILILRSILRLDQRERQVFLPLFVAVNVMMLVSNSYNLRIQVAQVYYIILAFIEIPRTQSRGQTYERETAGIDNRQPRGVRRNRRTSVSVRT